MKKLRLFLFIALVIALPLAACKKDDPAKTYKCFVQANVYDSGMTEAEKNAFETQNTACITAGMCHCEQE